MLYLLAGLRSFFGPLRLFEYVTFRSGCALLTAMFIVDDPETQAVLRTEISPSLRRRR